MSQETLFHHIKLTHRVIVKSPGLLPMRYKVSELSEELSLPERTLRDWLALGAPHERDQAGHLWINGQAFAGWVISRRHKTAPARLKPGEGYCMSCKQTVTIFNPTQHPSTGKLVCIKGFCPLCNGKIVRGSRHDLSE
jgi:hypothetical protein